MANEFKHLSIGGELTQAEYEAVGGHVLESQAIGDIIYATSTTQLSRLGIGATNTVLVTIGGVPSWATTLAGLTLTAPTINGVVGGTQTSATITALTISSMAGNWTNAGRTVADMGIATTIDINGGTIDGVVIGGAATAAITGTAVTGTSIVGGTVAGTTGSFSTSLALATGATVTGIDNGALGSSATLLATQGAIKTYVDAQVTAQDLDFQGDSGGALSIDLDSETLDIAGGTGIDTVGGTNTLTVNIDSTVATLTGSQTLTNKTLTAPTLTTPALGTPASGVLTNATGYTGDTALVTTGVLNSGSINTSFGVINNGASAITTTGLVSAGSLTVTGTTTLNGALVLGDAAGDTLDITASATVSTDFKFADDIDISLGSNADILMRNRSTAAAANLEITDIILGTSVHPGVAANSLLVSNITANGDMMFATNRGGNSEAHMLFDASAGDTFLYARGVQAMKITGGGAIVVTPSITANGGVVGDLTGDVTGNADTVTTNANLTGMITSSGNTASLGSFTLAQLNTALSDDTLGGGGSDMVSTNNLSDVANAGTSRTNLGVAIGSNVQAYSAVLDAVTAGTDLTVAQGGTGVSTLTDGGVLIGSGTGAITAMAVLADGEMIVGDGTTDPVAESGATLRASIGVAIGSNVQAYSSVLDAVTAGTDLTVGQGGTGVSTLTDHGVVLGSGTAAVSVTSAGTSGQVLTSGGSGADPDWATPTTGDITNVIAGAGMTGGATTGEATLNVIGGTGITANANEIVITPAQTTITSIYATDLIIGEDAQTAIDFGTPDEIDFKINNAAELTLDASSLYPVTDVGLNLGSTAQRFQTLYGQQFHMDASIDGIAGDSYSGMSATLRVGDGAAVAAWDLVCISDVTNEVQVADADAVATSRVIGINPLNATIADNAEGVILFHGFVRNDAWGWTPGATLYLHTAGTGDTISQTAPSGTDDCVVVIGVALEADMIYFNPSGTVIEHA